MADRYWVGGNGTWNTTNTANWSASSGGAAGATVPTATDNVFFDVNSNVGTGAFSVALGSDVNCANFTASGLDGAMTLGVGSSVLNVYGNWSNPATNFSVTTVAGIIRFQLAAGVTSTFASNGVTFASGLTVTVQGSTTGTLQLSGAFTFGGLFDHLAGTLDLNGFTLTTGIFGSSTNTTRAISFGSANIALTSSVAATTILNCGTVTNLTCTGTGGFVRNQVATATVTFGSSGGSASAAPNLSITGGSAALTITTGTAFSSSSWLKNLNFTGSTCTVTASGASGVNLTGTLTLATGGTYTGFGVTFRSTATLDTLAAPNNKQLRNIAIEGTGTTVSLARTTTLATTGSINLSTGTLNLNGFDISAGTFTGSGGSISFGSNNIFLTSTTAGAVIINFANATSFTYTGTGGFVRNQAATATATFGTTGGSISNAPNLTVNGGASALTITSNSWFKNLNFNGSTCSVGNSSVTTGVNVAGALTLSAGGTYTGFHPSFRVTATLDTTATPKTLGGLTVNGSGITVSLLRNTTVGATGITTITEGTLDLNGFTLSTGSIASLSSLNRSIAFGTQSITLSSTTSATSIINIQDATNFTWTGTGGFLRSQATTATISFGNTAGGSVSNAINVSVTAGGTALTFSTGSWVKDLNATGSTCPIQGEVNIAGTLTLSSGGSYTLLIPTFRVNATLDTIAAPNNKTLGGLGVNGSGITLTLARDTVIAVTGTTTLTNGTLDLGGFNLTTGIFSSSNTNTRSIAFGANSITLSSATAATTILNMATATSFTWSGTGGFTRNQSTTATVNFGATAGGTSSNAVNLSVTAGASLLTITGGSYFKDVNFTGSTCAVSGSVSIVGNLTLASGGTYTGMTPIFRGTSIITSSGKTCGSTAINSVGASLTLADAMSASFFTLTNGTLYLNGFTLSLTSGDFFMGAGTKNITFDGGSIIIPSASTTSWNNANPTGFTTTAGTGVGTISMTAATAKTFVGGGSTYNCTLNQGGAGNLTITGSNTFDNITNTTQPATVLFTAGTTNTFNNFSLSGTAGNLITIGSVTAASHTLSKSSGSVSVSYCSISRSTATGGASWQALTLNGNVDGGNNSGWIFAGAIIYDVNIAEIVNSYDAVLSNSVKQSFAFEEALGGDTTEKVLIANESIDESSSSSETSASQIFSQRSVDELSSGVDLVASILTSLRQIDESSSAEDSSSRSIIFAREEAESAQALDQIQSIETYNRSFAAQANAESESDGSISTNRSLSDTANAASTNLANIFVFYQIVENTNASDQTSVVSLSFPVNIDESSFAGDEAIFVYGSFPVQIDESAEGLDSASEKRRVSVQTLQSATISGSSSFVYGSFPVNIAETASPAGVMNFAYGTFPVAVSEAAAGAETFEWRSGIYQVSVSEDLVAVDVFEWRSGTYPVSITEDARTLDLSNYRFKVQPVQVSESSTIFGVVESRYYWEIIVDTQTANWQNVVNNQSPAWAAVSDTQTPSWQGIANEQSPSWSGENTAQNGDWQSIDAN